MSAFCCELLNQFQGEGRVCGEGEGWLEHGIVPIRVKTNATTKKLKKTFETEYIKEKTSGLNGIRTTLMVKKGLKTNSPCGKPHVVKSSSGTELLDEIDLTQVPISIVGKLYRCQSMIFWILNINAE
jgi:hypothetical protein